MLWEGMLVALVGAVVGQVLAIFYYRGVFHALNGVWRDVVRMEMLEINIRLDTLITGLVMIMGVSFLTLCFPLNRFPEQFPESSGTHIFLIDEAMADIALILNGWLRIFTVASSALKDQIIHAVLRNE